MKISLFFFSFFLERLISPDLDTTQGPVFFVHYKIRFRFRKKLIQLDFGGYVLRVILKYGFTTGEIE